MIVELELNQIIIPQGMLPRILTGVVEEKVEEYREMMEAGTEFDPIWVWNRDGSYWLIDGAHRLEAARRIGKKTIKARIFSIKEIKDEVQFRIKAIEANIRHGLPLKREEKVILAKTLYSMGVPIQELQKLFGVAERTIYNWAKGIKRREKPEELKEEALRLRAQGLTQEEVAKKLGIDQTTISKWEGKYDNLQKLQNVIIPSQKDDDEPDWDLLEKEWQRLKDEGFWDQDIDEIDEKKKKVGRPRKEEDTRSLEEQYEEVLYTEIIRMGINIGWVKTFEIVERAVARAREYSRRAVRGW